MCRRKVHQKVESGPRRKLFRLERFEFVWGDGKEVCGEGTVDYTKKRGWGQTLSAVGQGRMEDTFPTGCPASSQAPHPFLGAGSEQTGSCALHLRPADHIPLITYSCEVSIKSSGSICLRRNVPSHRLLYVVFTVTFSWRKAYNSNIYLMPLTIQCFNGPNIPLSCHNSRWHIEY